jgi:hypothetical protein
MLSRRLIRKLEALTDEAQHHLEQQADLLLTSPQHCRDGRPRLRLVDSASLRMARVRRRVSSAVTWVGSARW